MGADISRGSTSENFLSEFPAGYKYLKKVTDSVYGQGDIYLRRGDADIKIFSQQVMYNPEYRWKPTSIKHQNLISNLAILRHDDEVMCGDGSYLTVFYPYYERSLEQEIRNRENKPFQEAQVWYIFNALINANAALAKLNIYNIIKLKRNNKFCSDIRPINIRFKPDGKPCILAYGSFPKDLTGYQKALNLGQLTYLAPEQLEKLMIKAEQHDINQQYQILQIIKRSKADIFSLGMTLLVAMSFYSVGSFYNFQKLEIRQTKIKKTLSELSERYSEQLMRVLASTLYKNPEQRSTFEQLEALLDPYQKEIMSLREFKLTVDEIKDELNQNDEQLQQNQSSISYQPVPQYVTYSNQPVYLRQIPLETQSSPQKTQLYQNLISQFSPGVSNIQTVPFQQTISQYQPFNSKIMQSNQGQSSISPVKYKSVVLQAQQQQYIQNTPAFKQEVKYNNQIDYTSTKNGLPTVNQWINSGSQTQTPSYTQTQVSSVSNFPRGMIGK